MNAAEARVFSHANATEPPGGGWFGSIVNVSCSTADERVSHCEACARIDPDAPGGSLGTRNGPRLPDTRFWVPGARTRGVGRLWDAGGWVWDAAAGQSVVRGRASWSRIAAGPRMMPRARGGTASYLAPAAGMIFSSCGLPRR